MAGINEFFKSILENNKRLRALMPLSVKQKLNAPLVGRVDFGDFRRLKPIDSDFGFKRGQVIDRYYIEKFLESNSADIKGRVLELGDSKYTKMFGKDKVTKPEVLHYVEGNPDATIIGDLSKGDNIESDSFDCIILTQTLQMIYDFRPAVKTLHRILKPGGVLLVTTHGLSQMCRFLGEDDWGEYWRFTGQSGKILFEEYFNEGNVNVKTYGNVLTATSFLQGISSDELTADELNFHDKKYEIIVSIRALKSL